MSQMYANVIVPVPLDPVFTYRIPDQFMEYVKTGSRVIVPFGSSKFYTGIVESITPVAPQKDFTIKDIAHVPDATPILRHPQLRLWEWISQYYLCSRGDVMRAALPAGLKIESETMVECNPDIDVHDAAAALTEREFFIWQTLYEEGRMSLSLLATKTGVRNLGPTANLMLDKGTVIISEKLTERFKPKKEEYLRIALTRGDENALHEAFKAMHNAPQQQKLFMTLLEMSSFMHCDKPLVEVTRSSAIDRAEATPATISALKKKGLIESYSRQTSRFSTAIKGTGCLPQLSEAQKKALDDIRKTFIEKKTTLLHGVTASGKTEIYMHLISETLSLGRQVLYLVPEIALTTQLTERIQRIFGDKVIIYHSRFSDNIRAEIWRKILDGNRPCIVIGARSSVFLPFAQLGLVIVDEEHEAGYKQYDPAPRYNARDVAIVLAKMHGACTLLGSATPTIETYYKALNGKFGLVSLTERFTNVVLPSIKIVDMGLEYRKKSVTGAFADDTVKLARKAVSDGSQVIFFHNRRGFAPMARCKACADIPHCRHCDVSLTYHRALQKLVCHYCGTMYDMPSVCAVCGEPAIEIVGFGTERVEDDIENIFPDARVLRMDLDTTRKKDDYANIIDAFSEHKADILVGTQMVTKGLDFAHVTAVGVLNADMLINQPDFRAAERAFNMLEQVAGRAGRQNVAGQVIVQTRQPGHPVISFLKEHDYAGFYAYELEERRAFTYPPFARIIHVYIKHRDSRRINGVADRYAQELRRLLGNRVFGPEEPVVARIQNLYIRKIMLKIEPNASMVSVKNILRDTYVRLMTESAMQGTTVYYDVDPQ